MKVTWIISALLANVSLSEVRATQLIMSHEHEQQL